MANTSESVLDQESLDTLRALDRPGQPSVLVNIVTTFLDSATVQADELRQAVAEIDLVGVRRVAHMLRSSAANVGGHGPERNLWATGGGGLRQKCGRHRAVA